MSDFGNTDYGSVQYCSNPKCHNPRIEKGKSFKLGHNEEVLCNKCYDKLQHEKA